MEQIKVNLTGELINVRLEELNPFQEDIKTLSDENYEKLKTAILKDGFSFSIHVFELEDSSLWVLDGHQRLACLLRMKEEGFQIPTLPCVMVEAESLEHARRLVLEGTSQYGSFQASALVDFSMKTGIQPKEQLDRFALPSVDLAKLINVSGHTRSIGENEVPEPPKNPKTKRGNVYQLGNHRLMCGDSTMIDDVEKLMNGEKAEMLFTDPPYGVNYEGGHFHSGDVNIVRKREKLAADESAEIYKEVSPIIEMFVDGPCYTWFASTKAKCVIEAIEAIEAIGTLSAMLVWHKTNAKYGAMNAQYKQRHEPCFYWKPKKSTLRWCGASTESTLWEVKRDGTNEFHPTQKPVELAERALKNHTAKNVLDLFGGSGSTLIAAEKVGRPSFLMELSEKYCDVIVSRWEKYTGKKAVLL